MNAGVNANVIENNDDTFVTLTDYPMYEIDSQYPHNIRKKGQYGFLKESNTKGYLRVSLYGEKCYKHRLIAKQFIPNPEGLPCVDHRNHNRSDNRVENLRWTSYSENSRNLSSSHGIEYEFVDELEANALQINSVNGYEFEGYWLAGNEILFYDGVRYRILFKRAHGNQWQIRMRDVEGNSTTVTKRKLDKAMSEEYEMDFNI